MVLLHRSQNIDLWLQNLAFSRISCVKAQGRGIKKSKKIDFFKMISLLAPTINLFLGIYFEVFFSLKSIKLFGLIGVYFAFLHQQFKIISKCFQNQQFFVFITIQFQFLHQHIKEKLHEVQNHHDLHHTGIY